MKRLIALLAGAGFLNGTMASTFVVDGNIAGIVGATISTVALTLIVVAWIDRRIDHKIRNYAAASHMQHYVTLREISNLRELLGHPPLNIPEILKLERAG